MTRARNARPAPPLPASSRKPPHRPCCRPSRGCHRRRSGRTCAVAPTQGLLHESRPGRDQPAQVRPSAASASSVSAVPDAGQHAGRMMTRRARPPCQETVHAQPLRFGIGVAHAAGLAGVRSQTGVAAEKALASTAATSASRSSSTTDAAATRSGLRQAGPGRCQRGGHVRPASPPRRVPASRAAAVCSAHFRRVLPRSSSNLMRDAP